ncbi:dGTPase [Marinomonas piezotolerans]|uniref:Deoxyguanosinetriphosphate triphosphohydrolase-like protein n=1 Tax=Marinomonas piezotolerans TaxID=2213058 RepID=A0A370U4Q5_9GAMM|nr:anti-phage deoxyguanosine triphosphatase [Marinomonas piezotolerans]RDL42765.1 dGTPase [Marinomonas piezotolerans]
MTEINQWEQRWGNDVNASSSEDDVRNEWERDYARLIHSAAFRRLQSKTQVLGLGESDFYRTRLTHSMEVAQIGTGIVRYLRDKKHRADEDIKAALPKSALMNAICLAHDIGHPPFGHGGEVALNICMRAHGGFEGNGQTLRILSRLEKYTLKHGMAPTRRLLLGVLKYPASYNQCVQDEAYQTLGALKWLSPADKQHPPKCYLDTEREVVDWILEPFSKEERESFIKMKPDAKSGHLKPMYKGLDTSIMELADDISYSLHDLEDAISLGMITDKDWQKHNGGKEDIFQSCGLSSETMGLKLFSEHSYERKRQIGDLVHKFITNTYVEETNMEGAVSPFLKWNAVMDKDCEKLRKHIFDLVKTKVIQSPNVQQLEFKGQKLVIELFDALSSDPTRLLPVSTVERYENVSEGSPQMRVICDYISGMTDEYATRMYEKIYHPHKGSIFDRL